MIEFLRPGALWAFPLAGVPLALHFWGRVRAQPTPFTALDLLREASKTHFSIERLRYWLLLLTRTFLLLMLILFSAKPGYRGVLGLKEVRGIFLIDASYSLQATQSGETAFDRARDIARTVFRSRAKGDRWGLVIFSDRIEHSISPEADPTLLLQALENARPSFRGTSYAAGFSEAHRLLKEGGTILFLSDLAAHGIDKGLGRWEKASSSVVAVEVVTQRPNAGILGIKPGGGGTQFQAEVSAGGGKTIRTGSVRPGKKGTSEFLLDPDSLSTDDRWFFVNPIEKTMTVCLVNGAPALSPTGDETYYIRPILESLSSHGIKVVASSPANLSIKDFSTVEGIVLLNPPPLPTETVDRLRHFVDSGGGLWVTAGDRGGGQSLIGLLPLAGLETRAVNESLEWAGSDRFPELKELLWNRVHVDRISTGNLASAAQTVVRTARTKSPVLTVIAREKGRVALWGATADRDWTNLPSKPAFPVMVGHLLSWLGGERGNENRSAYFVGDAIERAGEEDRPPRVQRPDGKTERMEWRDHRWMYQKTDVPGFYSILGARDETIAVNVRAVTEGNLARLTPNELKTRLGDIPMQWIPAEKARPEKVVGALQGRDLTPAIVRTLFVLLSLETLFLVFLRRKKI